MSCPCSSLQITSFPSPSPRTSARVRKEFLERVGSRKPSMKGLLRAAIPINVSDNIIDHLRAV